MKRTKTDWRSRLNAASLNDLLTVSLESPDITLFEPLPAIELWHDAVSRRCTTERKPRKKQEKKEKKTETETETATEMTDTVELDSRDDECQSDSDFEDEIEEPVSTEGFLESLKKGGHIDFSPFVCDIGMEDDMMFDFRS